MLNNFKEGFLDIKVHYPQNIQQPESRPFF